MVNAYFPAPPASLSSNEQRGWLLRLQEAERIVGIADAGIPQVSSETLSLWQRYVLGELTSQQVVLLQCQRLHIR
jgi:hypothetical protein